MAQVTVRKAVKEDCPQLLGLIKELASYEKMADRVTITEKDLENDGFGDDSFFKCFVAENCQSDTKILVGYVLYYYIYSTFNGRAVYIEDVFVKPSYRGQKIGLRLWKSVAKEAVEKKCVHLDFVVLSWNESAIKFYQGLGAVNTTERDKFVLYRLEGDALTNVAK